MIQIMLQLNFGHINNIKFYYLVMKHSDVGKQEFQTILNSSCP